MKIDSIFSPVPVLALILVGVGAPFSVSAEPLPVLNRTIIGHLPAKDLPDFRATVGNVLGHEADGATRQWTSTHRARRGAVQVALTPQQTVQTRTASTCRLLDAKVTQGPSSENWRFWFCREEGGQWKASGGSLPGTGARP